MRRRYKYLFFTFTAFAILAAYPLGVLMSTPHWGRAEQSPLHSAVLADDLPTARRLLASAPPHAASQQLFYARSTAMAEFLIASGASVHARDHGNYTPLHFAACIGTTDVMHVLLKHGADPNAVDDGHTTPLMLAVGFGGDRDSGFEFDGIVNSPAQHLTATALLLDAGAKADARDLGGSTPLVNAARVSGSIEIIKLLVAAGADVNARTVDNITPLHSAASAGDLPIVRFLVEHGADPNVREWQGKRPVDCLQGPNADEIRMLLSK